ncbi:MAG: sigma 54-interacting transcriptional regulator [Candidatus Binatia bacterium]
MNMHLTALVFSLHTRPVWKRLEWDSIDGLRKALSHEYPAAYLARNRDLDRLRWFDEIFIDRGRKHPAKALAALLLGKKKMPLIEGSYSHPGQLHRGVRRLLAHAVARGERNAYIIGVDDALFDRAWKADGVGRVAQPRWSAPGLPTHATPPLMKPDTWEAALSRLAQVPVPDSLLGAYLGVSANTQLVRQLIMRAALSEAPVLITGPMGSGKEVIARWVHNLSGRRPFVPVNCAAVPRGLIESELFGYAAGAFTDATFRRDGLWKQAGNGTLFLDEIGDASKDVQLKLLRALEERKIRPLGTTDEIDAPARILAATSRNLAAAMLTGKFRPELYFRLSVLTIPAAPLSERPEDIPELAQFFWKQLTSGAALPPEIVAALQLRPWTGNVRELKAVLTKLFTLFGDDTPSLEQLRTVFQLHDIPFQSALGTPALSLPNMAGDPKYNGGHQQ